MAGFGIVKMHRPRPDGAGGQRTKKRPPRKPNNTLEIHRQDAIKHGETLMPNDVIYRTPNSAINNNESIYNSVGYDGRPHRPDSIEIRRSYQTEHVDGYPPNSPNHQQSLYATTQPHQLYEESGYYAQNSYANSAMSPESVYAPGTPTRKIRPTQPPPAPPSTGNTPNASNANTPTRNKSISSRDALPPPPPVPMVPFIIIQFVNKIEAKFCFSVNVVGYDKSLSSTSNDEWQCIDCGKDFG